MNGFKSEVDLFNHIWNTRPHMCEITGVDLEFTFNTDMWYSCFAHLYPKGKFPRWKYVPANIMLMHPDVHNVYDNGTIAQKQKVIGDVGNKIINKRKIKVLECKSHRG